MPATQGGISPASGQRHADRVVGGGPSEVLPHDARGARAPASARAATPRGGRPHDEVGVAPARPAPPRPWRSRRRRARAPARRSCRRRPSRRGAGPAAQPPRGRACPPATCRPTRVAMPRGAPARCTAPRLVAGEQSRSCPSSRSAMDAARASARSARRTRSARAALVGQVAASADDVGRTGAREGCRGPARAGAARPASVGERRPSTPCPGVFHVARRRAAPAQAAAAIARATGGAATAASAAASASASPAATPSEQSMSTQHADAQGERAGLVEHHSRACAPSSSASSRRTSTPRRASAPAAASSAAGVASDSAHGQVTISTATATPIARAGSSRHQPPARPPRPAAAPPQEPGRRCGRRQLGDRAALVRGPLHQRDDLAVAGGVAARSTRTSTGAAQVDAAGEHGAAGGVRGSGVDSPVSSASSTWVSPSSTWPSAGNALARLHADAVAHGERAPARARCCRRRAPAPPCGGRRRISASSAPAVRSRSCSSSRPDSRKNTNIVTESYQTSPPSGRAGRRWRPCWRRRRSGCPAPPARPCRCAPWRRSRQAERKKGPQENSSTGSVSSQEAQRSSAAMSGVISPGPAMYGHARTSSPASCRSPPPASATAACAAPGGAAAPAGRRRAGRGSPRAPARAASAKAGLGRVPDDAGGGGGAVHLDAGHAGQPGERLLDGQRAAGAVDALDGEVGLPAARAAAAPGRLKVSHSSRRSMAAAPSWALAGGRPRGGTEGSQLACGKATGALAAIG